MKDISRRHFLEFMGRAALAAGATSLLPACAGNPVNRPAEGLPFRPIKPTRKDDLVLADGFESRVLISWGDPLNGKERFGFNNDFTAYFPLDPRFASEGLLWVNHEYHDPYYTRDWRPGHLNTAQDALKDRKEVGGSLVHIRQLEGKWQVIAGSKYNRRLDGFTKIPFVSERPIAGARHAIGTMGNCAGGITPWGTVLTCEENYQNFVGEVSFENGKRRHEAAAPYLSWGQWNDLPPEHYGWVVEVQPRTGHAKKLTALGRFAHESATTIQTESQRTVVYSGDDTEGEHLYKFISSKPNSLEHGELYVADLKQGRWLPLNRAKDPRLKKAFKDHTELLIRTREAAKIVGATPLNRPEDIEIDPHTRAVFVSLTMNKKAGDKFGSLLKIEEKNADPMSLEFTSSTFLAGGPATGFANPDNLVFDRKGNLWMTTDMSETSLYKDDHAPFANNGLFFIPFSGPSAGRAVQVASAPRGAELTGPSFSADGKTLFLSVQHPGERAHRRPELTSHWPEGGSAMPKPSVVAIGGPALESIVT